MDLQCIIGSHDLSGHFTWIFNVLADNHDLDWTVDHLEYMVLCQAYIHNSLTSTSESHLAKYFTYHIPLASYFGGHYVTPKKCHPI